MSKKRDQSIYFCSECGDGFTRWAGKCPSCGSWNTLRESEESPGRFLSSVRTESSRLPIPLIGEVEMDGLRRYSTGMADLDLILGGGIVPASFILIGGEPGVGKSTLILEIARGFSGRIYYFSGEESPAQIRMRAERMEIHSDRLYISGETEIDSICSRVAAEKPDLCIVDSIQTLYRSGQSPFGGGHSLLKESALHLLELSKKTKIPIIVTGHLVKDGTIAGPRMIEHMVDVVLYFECDRMNHFRILRAVKNRFGTVGELAIFEMHAKGLRETPNLSIDLLLENRPAPGRVYTALAEGTRALVVEVQSLVSRSYGGQTRRMAEGLDGRRLILMAAVLEKYLKLNLGDCDLFANLAGGLNADEPALDLALCAAIFSSYREIPIRVGVAFLGEVGLSGEIRPVSMVRERVKKMAGLGFSRFCIPLANLKDVKDIQEPVQFRALGHIAEIASPENAFFA